MPFADVAALAVPAHTVVAPVTATPWKTIIVRPGDTLWHLAIANHTSVRAIAQKNRLPLGGALIHPGQKLLVPGKSPVAHPRSVAAPTTRTATAVRPSSRDAVHVVRAGDTTSDIAKKYRVSLTKLLAANKLRSSALIFVGQKIVVPGAVSVKAPATPAPKPTAPKGYTVSAKTAKAVAASKAKLAAAKVPTRTQTSAIIRATAARHGVDPKLALAIGWLESGWHQRAVSYTNAVGVMQIMPTSQTWASELAGRSLDRFDTRDNITSGVLIIRSLQASADSREQAIAGYYQGLYSVRTKGLYEDTKQYVASVLAIYNRL
ncbi:MAG: LysM peptidoglycan-binding domain-containing protein [Dermatophilaceae bacterium]|nr:LysM peptidoglycan-binding domain-containing protein [Dermatophilaceae bacterium]NUQ31572.1 LysM peptidoglycan-binding domain-containing protein [Dermatophilaceae bacterium]